MKRFLPYWIFSALFIAVFWIIPALADEGVDWTVTAMTSATAATLLVGALSAAVVASAAAWPAEAV